MNRQIMRELGRFSPDEIKYVNEKTSAVAAPSGKTRSLHQSVPLKETPDCMGQVSHTERYVRSSADWKLTLLASMRRMSMTPRSSRVPLNATPSMFV